MDFSKICANCAHEFCRPGTGQNRRCDQSGASPESDISLCANVRRADGTCGPDGTRYEKKAANG